MVEPKISKRSNKRRKPNKPIKNLKGDVIENSGISEVKGKVLSANQLNWKDVKIGNSVDVVEGFFGLEEIEGVTVKYGENGQAQFIVKDKTKIKDDEKSQDIIKTDKLKTNGSFLSKEEEQMLEEGQTARKIVNGKDLDIDDVDEEEFTGFEDDNIEETSNEKNSEDKLTMMDLEQELQSDNNEEDEIDEEWLNDYRENIQTGKLRDLLDEEATDIEVSSEILTNWSEMSLSKYSLHSLEKLGFKMPTEVQKLSIPLAIANHDLIGKASTGSGKTLAYGLPILEKCLLNIKEKKTSCPTGIIFTPTRELAKQVHSHLTNVCRYLLPSKYSLVVSITGGLSIQKQERQLSFNPGIIIATPGRMLELIELNNNNLLDKLSGIQVLVLDEADRLLQDGHFAEMEKIIEILNKARLLNNNKKWQTLVFSATFSKTLFSKLDKNIKKANVDKKNKKNKKINNHHQADTDVDLLESSEEIVAFLKEKLYFKDKFPKVVNVNPREMVSGSISEALIECDAINRDLYLYYFLITYPGSTLIFTNSIDSVKRLNVFLRLLRIKAFSIHSSMLQKQRLRNLENFQKACLEGNGHKDSCVLIATDVAARGLDIPNIDHVVHYHLPRSADLYIHRSGRTGRAGKEGVSIMLCSPKEASGPLRRLRKLLKEESVKIEKKKALTEAKGDKKLIKSLLFKFQSLDDDDVKLLPIEVSILDQLRERSTLANELSESEISKNSLSKEDSWVSKIAKDLEIDDLSDFEDETLKKNRQKKVNKSIDGKTLSNKKVELNSLLQQQIRLKSVGGSRKYLTNGLVNYADIMLKGKGHENIVGKNSIDVLDVIKKSKSHQERLTKLEEQQKMQKEQIKEKKIQKGKDKKERRKNSKRKRDEKIDDALYSDGEGTEDGEC